MNEAKTQSWDTIKERLKSTWYNLERSASRDKEVVGGRKTLGAEGRKGGEAGRGVSPAGRPPRELRRSGTARRHRRAPSCPLQRSSSRRIPRRPFQPQQQPSSRAPCSSRRSSSRSGPSALDCDCAS